MAKEGEVTVKVTTAVDSGEVDALEEKITSMNGKGIGTDVDVDKSELDATDEEIENMNGKTIGVNVDVDSAALQDATQNISQGVSTAKQGLSGLAGNINEVQQAGMQSEQNLGFLANNVGGMEKARDVMGQINDIVASMPGDDNTMRSVLSTAQALGNNLNPDEMRSATATMADYMQGSATMGKQAIESQQDIMKYLLDGNTAELERGSIVSSRVDKLKEATTFQERQAAMQEVLNELGYGGIAGLDTTINKQAEWEGMMYNSQDALSSMWLGAEKGAMDYILKLNDASGGILGMGIVAGQMAAGPIVDLLTGVGQVTMGLKGLKDGFSAIKDLGMIGKIKDVVSGIGSAFSSLFSILAANPIILVVIAIVALIAALIWAYYNVDWFREMVDNAFASLVQFGQFIYGVITGALQWLGNLFQQFTSQLGLNTNDWLQAILGFILFIPQLPLKVGAALINAIAHVFGFKGNFVQSMISAGSNAINGFVKYIQQLPGIVLGEFKRVLGLVNDFINDLPSKVWDMGVAIIGALKKALGIGSPGHMYYMLEGEFERMNTLTDKTDLNTARIGEDMVSGFNPNLNNGIDSTSAGGKTFNINIENVDSEERIQQIVDAVEEALKWDNLTAGRSV